MTRVSENQNFRVLVSNTIENKRSVNEFAEQVSTGIKVRTPGDSSDGGTVSRYRELLQKIDTYQSAIDGTRSVLDYQDIIVTQANDLLVRAKELAAQGANETNSVANRRQIAEEVFAIRDSLINLANSTYQGRYVYGCSDDDDPPFDNLNDYAEPLTGAARERWVFDGEPGTAVTRAVNIADNTSIRVNTPANNVFSNSIFALERLGRSLAGYSTLPAAGPPTGAGTAYVFPAEFGTQTRDIQAAMDFVETARAGDIQVERTDIAARLQRLDAARQIHEMTKFNAKEVLSRIQDADEVEAASGLATAQTALQASYTVTARVLNLSILDYL